MKFISKESLREDYEARLASGQGVHVPPEHTAVIAETKFGAADNVLNDEGSFSSMSNARILNERRGAITISGKYRSGFDVPLKDGKSFNDLIAEGRFSRDRIEKANFASNSLIDEWQQFWDAMRIDLTMKREAHQTIRQYFYNVISMPNATRIMSIQEMYPYAFEFKENNAEGQAVPLGEKLAGQKDTVEFKLFAAGFKYTLLAQLWDRSLDLTKMTEGVANAYALKRDDDAVKPILDYNYGAAGTAKHTAAHTQAGALRQELLYNTLFDAVDDLGKRKDPFTKKFIPASGLTLLCSTYDANHIQLVMSGLPSVNERKYGAIPQISRVVVYDDDEIRFSDKVIEYAGVTPGTAFLIKPNRYMMIPTKRELTMEFDPNPDVLTLSREERAWYYSEAIYNLGIESFIQKITLPTW